MDKSAYSFGKRLGGSYKIVGIFILSLVALGIYDWQTPKPTQELVVTHKPVAPAATPSKEDIEINIVLAGAQRLKDGMKKPETFELLKAGMIDGKVICYEYRARNSFNDRIVEKYVVSDTVSSGKTADWNKYCAGKSATDYTSVRAVLR